MQQISTKFNLTIQTSVICTTHKPSWKIDTKPYMNTWNRHIHTSTQNVHNVHNAHTYNIGIPKQKNTYDFFVQVRNFLLPLSLKVFRHKERDTIFLYWLFHLPQTTCTPVAHKFVWSQSHLTDLSQISAHASVAWRHSHPWSYPLFGIFIVTSLNDTSAPCVRVNTCVHVCT